MKKFISNIISSFILVIRNSAHLIFAPYKSMRVLSKEYDPMQIGIIFAVTYAYFVYASAIRTHSINPLVISKSAVSSFSAFLVTFTLVVGFFYYIGKYLKSVQKPNLNSLIMLFSYSLLPTFVWFVITSSLFILLPPPRQPTLLGKTFSMVFTVFSLTLLLWRMILLYLSVRFSMKAQFFSVMLLISLFLLWFLPYAYGMYKLNIFRIPYI